MELPRKLKVEGPDSPEKVDAAYRASREARERERLQAIRLAQQGRYTLAQIAEIVGRGRATMGRWGKDFRAGRIKKLLRRRHGGKRKSLSAADQQALRRGLRKGHWKTAGEIRKWLREKRQVRLTRSGIYYGVYRVGGGLRVPRKSHVKKDSAAVEAFKKQVTELLEALDIPAGPRVQIWVEDEHRYGLISVVRRCWALKGHRPPAAYQTKYPWGYVYGAVNFGTGQAAFLYTPTVTLEWSRIFLEQLMATDPEALHIILWDQAGFHPTLEDAEWPENVRLLPFPAYSPELNPIETLWDQVKRRVANEAWPTLAAIEAAITEVLAPYWEDVERVRSLLGDTWLTRGGAAFLERRASAAANG
jgi:transposase